MLSVEMSRREDLYGYRNSFYNVVWLTGLIRNVDVAARTAVLHRTNNANQGFPFTVKDTDRLPAELQVISEQSRKAGAQREIVGRKIIARMVGTRNSRGLPTIQIVAISINKPNVVEMPPRIAFQGNLRPGVPDTVDAQPEEIAALPTGAETDRMILRELRQNVRGNDCKVSGYIQAMNFTAAKPREGGGTTEPSLELLIRQTEKADDLIPVVLRGRTARKTAEALRPRDPIYAAGRLEALVKNMGEPGPDGIIPVSTRVVVRTDEIQTPDAADLLHQPKWLASIPLESGSRRQRPGSSDGSATKPLVVDGTEQADRPQAAAIPADVLALMTQGQPAI